MAGGLQLVETDAPERSEGETLADECRFLRQRLDNIEARVQALNSPPTKAA